MKKVVKTFTCTDCTYKVVGMLCARLFPSTYCGLFHSAQSACHWWKYSLHLCEKKKMVTRQEFLHREVCCSL